MCFLDHSFGYNAFVLWLFAKSMLKFREKEDALSTDSQIRTAASLISRREK